MPLNVLHPVFVHFPIAFFTLNAFLLVLRIRKKHMWNIDLDQYAYFAVWIGYISMFVTMSFGLFDFIRFGYIDNIIAITHASFASSLIFIYGFHIFLRFKYGQDVWKTKYKYLYLGSMLLGIIIVYITGFFGGKLVYG